MSNLFNALLKVKNPNIQDMGAMQYPVTAEGMGDYGKGLISGVAGVPGDISSLFDALIKAKQGIPPINIESKFGTDAIGRLMGADVNSAPFTIGSIGIPGIEDLLKPVAIGSAIMGGVKGINHLAGLKQTSHADELIGALMARGAPGADVSQAVFHGSPHRFDKFQTSQIGTGEGAQAYGHGLYFAENKGVANSYRPQQSIFSAQQQSDAEKSVSKWLDNPESADVPDELRGTFDKLLEVDGSAMPDTWDRLYNDLVNEKGGFDLGNLYEADIPDSTINKMLDWDKPLSEQSDHVKRILRDKFNYDADKYPNDTGQDAYRDIVDLPVGGLTGVDMKPASDALTEAGIPGIKYLDGTSRSAGKGTRNYVVFDENNVKALKRNGKDLTKDKP